MNGATQQRNRWGNLGTISAMVIILGLSVLFIWLRIGTNGKLTDSVAAQDTQSYFACAERNFLSREGYTCSRSATIPFLYHLLNPSGEVELTKLAEPVFGSEPRLAIQPGTERIVTFQIILSIVSWLILTWSVAFSFRRFRTRVTAALILFSFAFVPQLSDWDSILLSESVSFSLFALMSAFFLTLLTLTLRPEPLTKIRITKTIIAAVLFFISAYAWVFTRDTNAYFLILLIIALGLAAVLAFQRRAQSSALISLVLGVLLSGLFAFHQATFRESERWMLPMLNNYVGNVFPYESRVAWFEERGMPAQPELIAKTGSAEYNDIYEQAEFIDYIKRSGTRNYISFLIHHPLLTLRDTYFSLDGFFAENIQPFYYGADEDKPRWAEPLGNLLHPLSSALIILVPLLCAAVWLRGGSAVPSPRVLFLCTLTLGAFALIWIAYLGEVRSIWRHVLSGVLVLRLALWLAVFELIEGKPDEAT